LIVMTVVFGLLLLASQQGFTLFSKFAFFLAMSLLLSCMSTAINRISVGIFDEGYMPDIALGLYDIFISPIKLAIGIVIVTYSPLIVAIGFGLQGIVHSVTSKEQATGFF